MRVSRKKILAAMAVICAAMCLWAGKAFATVRPVTTTATVSSISPIRTKVNVKVPSLTTTYDGMSHSLGDFTVTSSPYTYGLTVVWDEAKLTMTDAGSATTSSVVDSLRIYVNGQEMTGMFELSVEHGTLTIAKAPATLEFQSVTKEYNGASQAFALEASYTSGLVSGDTVSSGVRVSGKDVGVYESDTSGVSIYSPSRKRDVTSNYDLTCKSAKLTITPSNSVVTITPDAKSAAFGEADKPLTATVTGALGDDASKFVFGLARTPGTAAGTYQIRVTDYLTGTANKNYAVIRPLTANYTIDPVLSYAFKGNVPSGAPKLPAATAVKAGQTYTVFKVEAFGTYKFSGWSSTSVKVSNGRFTVPAGVNQITLTGSFAENVYTITYILDGEIYETQSVMAGKEIVPLEPPADQDGKQFRGWQDIPSVMPAEDITVLGTYDSAVFYARFYINSTLVSTLPFAVGEAVVPPEAPDGYTGFSGWKIPDEMPANDIDLYAIASVDAQSGSPESPAAGSRAYSPLNFAMALAAIALCCAYNFGLINRGAARKPLLRALGIASCLLAVGVCAISLIGAQRMALADKWTPVCAAALAIGILAPLRLGKKAYYDSDEYYEDDAGKDETFYTEYTEYEDEETMGVMDTAEIEVIRPEDTKKGLSNASTI